MTKQALTAWRLANRIPFGKILPDGRLVGVTRLVFGFLLWVGDTDGWHEGWEYPTLPQALAGAVYFTGDGDPMVGWERHRRVGQPDRLRPEGDLTREYLKEDPHA